MKATALISVLWLVSLLICIQVSVGQTAGVNMSQKSQNSGKAKANTSAGKADSAVIENPVTLFAAYAEDEAGLHHVLVLVESLRNFGGRFANAPVWVYLPEEMLDADTSLLAGLRVLNADVRSSSAPQDASGFPFAGKTFAAAAAESDAAGRAAILVWMDEDTVILDEPAAFALAGNVVLGYRPVMHQLIGSLYDSPPDAFWSRLYKKLSVPQSALFRMSTVADHKVIRPYFNAGLLVVRPERGVLRQWVSDFKTLYQDSVFVKMCNQDRLKRIFLHQTALTGAILNVAKRKEIIELPDRYNFPLFFADMYGGLSEFDDITGVVTLRYDIYFNNPAPDWRKRLKGATDKVTFLGQRLERRTK